MTDETPESPQSTEPTESPVVAGWSRRRTRWTWAVGLLLGVVACAQLDAPYATVKPGPTPELSALVAAQNDAHDLDPTFGTAGEWHATTIDATGLSWLDLAVCKVRNNCDVFPLATGSSSKQQAADSMQRSVDTAAEMASTWTFGLADHDTRMFADMGEVGGGSAGLMLTLAFIDAATDGDLTGGRIIAGTGTMNSLAEVGPVSGVEHKVAGALAAGADVFFAPALRADEAEAAAAGTGLRVVSVSHLPDALRWLCENGGESRICNSPALVEDDATP